MGSGCGLSEDPLVADAAGSTGVEARAAQALAMLRHNDPQGGAMLDEQPAHAAPRVDLGRWCSSAHHLQPMPAEVAGTRARGADDPHGEDVSLCGRCADLLGDAGFFVAA